MTGDQKMQLQSDYAERVYAGVLGKIIGVYLGRPFEGWEHREILTRLGEIDYYVNDRIVEHYPEKYGHSHRPPLVVTDDDITGTFTFVRAIDDYDDWRTLSPRDIGETWLNYIIENRTILWWGGYGNSTEHTAYLRLKAGEEAPRSGSIEANGSVIAEQIGAQIFADAWAMIAPGDPERAVDLVGRAARVSHDGEAVYGAQVIAAMEAAAFEESGISRLIDIGLSMIPESSTISSMIRDVREWYEIDGDWYRTFGRIEKQYGYAQFPGNVHVVPNHALVILGLLYCDDDFDKALRIVNTAGWDTDCNSGNLGCLMGIKNGLSSINRSTDWRGPVRDRILMPTADGGRAITDAVQEALRIVEYREKMEGRPRSQSRNDARFSFCFPGAVQGFASDSASCIVENVESPFVDGERALSITHSGNAVALTPTFKQPDEIGMRGYELLASPTIYSGQTVSAETLSNRSGKASLLIEHYNYLGDLIRKESPQTKVEANKTTHLSWRIPSTGGEPIANVGIRFAADDGGRVYLNRLSWSGEPDANLGLPEDIPSNDPVAARTARNSVWRHAWVSAVDLWDPQWSEPFRLVQNSGRGLLIHGSREWANYEIRTTLRATLADGVGVCARIQGMRRYIAFVLRPKGCLQLIEHVEGVDNVLFERIDKQWEFERYYQIAMRVTGSRVVVDFDGEEVCDVDGITKKLSSGAVGFFLEKGHMASTEFQISPMG
jgi:ADP-ribosylglycohydrolase